MGTTKAYACVVSSTGEEIEMCCPPGQLQGMYEDSLVDCPATTTVGGGALANGGEEKGDEDDAEASPHDYVTGTDEEYGDYVAVDEKVVYEDVKNYKFFDNGAYVIYFPEGLRNYQFAESVCGFEEVAELSRDGLFVMYPVVDSGVSAHEIYNGELTLNEDDGSFTITGGFNGEVLVTGDADGNVEMDCDGFYDGVDKSYSSGFTYTGEGGLPSSGSDDEGNIAEIVCSNENTTLMCKYMEMCQVFTFYDGLYTAFVPTDDAFDDVADLIEDFKEASPVPVCQAIRFHIHGDERGGDRTDLSYLELECTEKIEMLDGFYSRTKCRDGEKFQTGKGNDDLDIMPMIIDSDNSPTNGVIHYIDGVMFHSYVLNNILN